MKSIFFVFAALSVMPFVHAADPYPNRPIKLVVQFPPGGTTDIVVENRAGASGIIGSDVAKDLTAVINVAAVPNVMTVNPKLPASNVKEFIATLKANPEKYAFATLGAVTSNIIFNQTAIETSFDKGKRMGQRGHLDLDTEKAVRRFLALIAGRYDVAGTIVFGSRARGTHRPDSDADVAVLLSGEHQRFLTTKLAMADVAFDVLLETGINISPLPVWLDEWEHPEDYSNPALLQNIASEGFRLN